MAVSTPCINVCVLDDRFGLCLGCGRTRAEIAAWGGLSEPERQMVMGALAERLRAIGSRKGRAALTRAKAGAG